MRQGLRGLRLVGLVSVAALAAACSGSGDGGSGAGDGDKKEAEAPVVTITPVDKTAKAKPEEGITVKSANGELQSVKVTLKGKEVAGTLSPDRTSWKADRALAPSSSYAVEAVAANGEKSTTATSRFKTLKPTGTLELAYNNPGSGQTVGVGMPIVIQFDRPVGDRKAVERSLTVESKYPTEGAWYWYDDKQVIFRTKKYWKPYQTVKVTGRLAGVKSAKGIYGVKDFTINFKIGSQNISTVNTKTHRMVVKVDGKKIRDVGISAGKATEFKYTTTNGIHITMDKKNPETMISPGIKEGEPGYYKEIVPYAVRISYSGEYVHAASWSVGSQGRANVSHGCVNAPPAFAQWYYNQSKWGDIVVVTGTTRELEYDNGYSYWQKDWKDWVLGSAFDKSVSTGPAADSNPSTAPSTTTPSTTDPSADPSATSPSESPAA